MVQEVYLLHIMLHSWISLVTRSGPFYTRDSERHTDLVRCVLKALADDETAVIPFEPVAWTFGLKRFDYIAESRPCF
ncbi:hypothetical protein B0H14DRAFT_3128994 [Mycena olivaceomarginata]|nr:hypothetical protein B0H14DRAFT_3128994 [Mycena olivaceomarginata]